MSLKLTTKQCNITLTPAESKMNLTLTPLQDSMNADINLNIREPDIESITEADKLKTKRYITLTGVVKGSNGFDGTEDVVIDTSMTPYTNAELESMLR